MTISELYKQVAQLGFEDSLEEDSRFYYAANRALLQVNKIRPAISHYLINHSPLKNEVVDSTFEPIEKSEDLTFQAVNVKSYYFEVDGNGVVYIEQHNDSTEGWDIINTITLSSSKAFKAYRGFIKSGGEFVSGTIRLRFSGEFIYSVKNVAMYSNLYSNEVSDIPAYEPYTRYDIKTLVNDFMALCCPPILEDKYNKVLNQEYEIEGNSIILLPYDNKGVYKVMYERRPMQIKDNGNASNDETIIDIDDELGSLLPILIASYVWIDDEPQKSEYYLSLYRERAIEIERKIKDTAPVIYKSSNGW